jgi:hypothetical protein
MCAKPDQPEQRDRVIARLLPRRPVSCVWWDSGRGRLPRRGDPGGVCRSRVSPATRNQLEHHFVACGQCQKILTRSSQPRSASPRVRCRTPHACFFYRAKTDSARPALGLVAHSGVRRCCGGIALDGAASRLAGAGANRRRLLKLAEQKVDSFTVQANPSSSPEVLSARRAKRRKVWIA